MKKLVIDGFEVNEEYMNMLLTELKDEKVKTKEDLKKYFDNYWYTKDETNKCHLLVSRHPKKRNFAIPFAD